MKKMKRFISLGLALFMLAGVFTGCGNSGSKTTNYTDNEKEDVTLVMALPMAKQADTDAVVAEINKILEEKLPNTKIELLLDANMADKWSLWMNTSKKIDLAHSGYCTDLENEVISGNYLELDGLIEKYAPTLAKLCEDYEITYDTGEVAGELYAVPNVQSYTQEGYFLQYMDALDPYLDTQTLKNEAWSSDKTTEKFWQTLTAGLDAAAAAGVDCSECVNLSLYNIAKRGYNFIGGDNSNLCYDNSEDVQIIDFYTTEEFTTFCKYMKDWASKGYVSKDVLTGQLNYKLHAANSGCFSVNEETGKKEKYLPTGSQMLYLQNKEDRVLTTNIGEQKTYWSIPFSSEHPARAIKFLDLLHSEEGADIANLLAYGIEGKHYEFTDKENGDIKAFEYQSQGNAGVSYGIPCWMVSNMLQGLYTVEPYTHEVKEYANDYYAGLGSVKKHVLYGCSFDTTSIRNQFSQLIKNNGEYAESVYSGIVADSDSILKELLSKNKAAGQEEIIKELQKQADAFIVSKK